jgi:hypothetical protein
MIHNHELRRIRKARTAFDDLYKVASASKSPEIRALARLMHQMDMDIWFGLIDLYRSSHDDKNALVIVSKGLEGSIEGERCDFE